MIEGMIMPGRAQLQPMTSISTQKNLSGKETGLGDFATLLAGMLLELGLPYVPAEIEELPDDQMMVDDTNGIPSILPGGLSLISETLGLEPGNEQAPPEQALAFTPATEQPATEPLISKPNETVQELQPWASLPEGIGTETKTAIPMGKVEPDKTTSSSQAEITQGAMTKSPLKLEIAVEETEPVFETEQKLKQAFPPKPETVIPKPENGKEHTVPLVASPGFTDPENKITNVESGLSLAEASRLFREALEQVSRRQGNDRQEVVLQLKPPNLGQVRLVLLHRTGEISARFEVENDFVRGALQANMTELEENLMQQGIRVEELSVFIGQGGTDNNESTPQQDRPNYNPTPTWAEASRTVSTGSNEHQHAALWLSGRLDLLI
jgi:flagellar hook-length control protein FliK